MYTPAYFAEPDGQRIASLIEQYGFATLLTPTASGLHITMRR